MEKMNNVDCRVIGPTGEVRGQAERKMPGLVEV